jgi:hypothetical protein
LTWVSICTIVRFWAKFSRWFLCFTILTLNSFFLSNLLCCSLLSIQEIVFVIQLLMKLRANPWKFKVEGDISRFKSGCNFLLKYDKFFFHFRIDIPLVFRWPEAPEGIADNVSMSRFLFNPKYVISEFHKNILSLNKLLFFLFLILLHLLIHSLFLS